MASTDSAERTGRHGPAAPSAPAGRQPLALRIVREEHERLAAVVHGMRHLARAMEEEGLRPDLKVLRAMLLYISEYPGRLHHPKEDRFLFAPLRDHTHLHDAMLVELEVQHAQGEAMVRRLAHALARHEFGGPVELAYFVQQVKRYADFYSRHMRLEEEVIFPALREHLTEQEWQEADEAFAGNRDPLAGLDLKQDFERLYTTIVSITPAPWGLGPAL
ncbi:hemerythrin domain-containing protein [Noviherbaspirillum sp. 1P10PC]|uniref:hemerythrin domain-containing protein n=1 Tax=Noviherbaspirillum sp. 1P10PC TaxID=3132292 RepID=UPI00399F0E91